MIESPRPLLLPMLCASCRYRVTVQQLQIPRDGPWITADVVVRILLFQQVTASTAFGALMHRATGHGPPHDATELNRVLTMTPCLGCAFRHELETAVEIVLRRGLDDAALISQNKLWDAAHVFERPPGDASPGETADEGGS